MGAMQSRCPSSYARGVEDAAPYGGSETNAAAYDVTGVVPSRLTNGARAVPAGLDAWGGGREVGAPWKTRVSLVTPAIRNHLAPAISQPRCTEDGAPYGRQRNERCGMERNGCRQTVPHGYAETYPHATTVGGGVLDAPSVGGRMTWVLR